MTAGLGLIGSPRNRPLDYSFAATLCKDHYDQSSEPTGFIDVLIRIVLMARTNGTRCVLSLKKACTTAKAGLELLSQSMIGEHETPCGGKGGN